MFSSGLASSTIRSASLPGSSDPRSLPSPMASHAGPAAAFHQGLEPGGVFRKRVLVLAEPAARPGPRVPTAHVAVELGLRREVAEFLVARHVLVRVEPVLRPRPAVGHE